MERRKSKRIGLAVVLTVAWGLGVGVEGAHGADIAVTDSNILSGLSPLNWICRSNVLGATVCGASLDVQFTGTSNVTVRVDTTRLGALSKTTGYPVLAWTINNGPLQIHQLLSNETTLALAAGVANPVLSLYVNGMEPAAPRWTGDLPSNSVALTAFTVDGGGATAPVALSGKVWLNIGDSIMSGDSAGSAEGSGYPSTWAPVGAGRASYGYRLARYYGCQDARIAYGGYNWMGGGFAPALTNLIDWTSEQYSRLTEGLLKPAPAVALINLGENGAPAASNVVTALLKVRSRLGPDPKLIVMVPVSGKGRTNLVAAFNTYIASNSDSRAYFVDPGSNTFMLADSQHPTALGHYDIFRSVLPLFTNILGETSVDYRGEWGNDTASALWNASDTNWSGGVWKEGRTAFLGATGVTGMTVQGTRMIGGLVVSAPGYSLGGGTLALASDPTEFAIGSDLAIGSAISGYYVLYKTGPGVLTLSGANLHAGTVVEEGVLRIGGGGALGPATASLMLRGGLLDLNGYAVTNGAFTMTCATNSALVIGQGGSLFVTNLLVNGQGGISNAVVNLLGGALQIASARASVLTLDHAVVTNVGQGVILAGPNKKAGSLTMTGGARLSSSGTSIVGHSIPDCSALIKGTQTVWNPGGASLYCGYQSARARLTITDGAVVSNLSLCIVGNSGASSNTLVVSNGGKLQMKGDNDLSLGWQAGDHSNTLTVEGANADTGALATVDLKGRKLLIGKTAGGTNNVLNLNADGVLTNVATILLGDPTSKLNLNGGILAAGLIGGLGTNYLGAGGVTFNNGAGNTVVSNAIANLGSGGGILAKAGSGILTLMGECRFNGSLRVAAGTVALTNTAAISAGITNVTILPGATVTVPGPFTNACNLVIGVATSAVPGRLAVSGAVQLGGALVLDCAAYSPSTGDCFTVLTAASISGTFSTLALPGLGAGLDWQTDYQSTAVVVRVTGVVPRLTNDTFAAWVRNNTSYLGSLTNRLDDPGNLGVPNLARYVFGGSATSGPQVARLLPSLDATSAWFRIQFQCNRQATDVTWFVEDTAGMGGTNEWSCILSNIMGGGWAGPMPYRETPTTNGVGWIDVADTNAGAPARFIRARVSAP